MTGQRISVVVPFYNNADLLGDCLASIAAQTFPGLQVIMVDDGSTDGSAAVARAQAAADPRFRLISVANGGPGSARNRGIAAATGEFLAFVDADDLLPPDAYATMVAVLDRSGSDFVSGGVLRLGAGGLGRSGLHARAVKARRLGTHISRSPELFYDISVWNKLFRRSFWDAAELSFPEGMLWEDLVAMTKAHVLAASVDVITEPVYHWRDRDAGAPSITQSRTDIGNFRDRITALTMIDEFLRRRGTAAMLRKHQHKALVNDLWLYVGDLPATGEDYQREFTELAAGYLATVPDGLTRDLPANRKLAYYLISRGRQAELAEFAAWLAANPGRTPPMVRVHGRLHADLPLRGDRELAIPARIFRPQWRELDPYVGVDSISWQPAALRIEGWAHVPSVDIGKRRHTAKLLVLVPRGRRRPPLVLPARSVRRPDVTAASRQERYSYDWSGFSADISTRLLHAGRRWLTGSWDCYMLVRGRGVWRPARLNVAGPPPADPGTREIAPGLQLGAAWTGGRLELRLRQDQAPRPAPTGVAATEPAATEPAATEPAATEPAAGQSWGTDGTLGPGRPAAASVPPSRSARWQRSATGSRFATAGGRSRCAPRAGRSIRAPWPWTAARPGSAARSTAARQAAAAACGCWSGRRSA
jgi:CDP-glycerol glycerophosphotransferase